MSRRNVTRSSCQHQTKRTDRAQAGLAGAGRNAALASRARPRGCTFPGLRDSQPVARADRESTRRLRSRRPSSGLAMRNRSASGARGRSGTRIRARVSRACARWLRFWRRTLIGGQYISGEKQKRPLTAASFAQGRQETSWTLPAAGRADGGAAGRMSPAGCHQLETPASKTGPYKPVWG